MSDHNKSKNGSNHRTNNGLGDGLNDADIKQLFDQQGGEPAQALDELILTTAKKTHTALPEADKPKRFTQKYTAVLGLAAMVLLGVVIVPLMTKQPEYTLDTNKIDKGGPVASLLEKAKQSETTEANEVIVAADSNAGFSVEQQVSDISDAGITIAAVSEPTSATRSSQPMQEKRALKSANVQAESVARPTSEPTMSTSIPARPGTSNTGVTPEDRKSPIKWIDAIKRLFEQNNLTQAKNELARFRQKHPDSKYEARLPATLREQTATE